MNTLEIKNLHVSYGPIEVLKGIDLVVPQGQIVALLGANGAGKTTVLKAISGLVKATGEVIFDGKKTNNLPPNKIASMGLTHCPEGRQLFFGLTVEENLKAGGYPLKAVVGEDGKKIKASARFKENLERVFKLFPVLEERKKQNAQTLSGGEQQMLAIARALMASPRLLVLDEPSLGLAPLIIRDIFKKLKEICEAGTTIFLVEQNAYATLKLADFAYVLELGKISMQGNAHELLNDERLVHAYLGGKK